MYYLTMSHCINISGEKKNSKEKKYMHDAFVLFGFLPLSSHSIYSKYGALEHLESSGL